MVRSAQQLTALPSLAMVETGECIDWSTAEALAFGSLADEGYPVRLSGQDSERGTFSQRHSVLIDQHSGERYIPERYLQSSAEGNWQVANCTTPANYFHILRRQLQRDFRKPLILMTPKSLLRHRHCKSDLVELTGETTFQRILRDDAETGRNGAAALVADGQIRRVLLCSGKIYYDLEAERAKRGLDNVYLLRLEQLYPFPTKAVTAELARFANAEVMWCQEEPKNMGAWYGRDVTAPGSVAVDHEGRLLGVAV